MFLSIVVAVDAYRFSLVGGYASYGFFVRLVYLFVYPISGFAHFAFPENYARGFFDLAANTTQHGALFGWTITEVALGYISLSWASWFTANRTTALGVAEDVREVHASAFHAWYGALWLVLGLYGNFALRQQIDTSVIERGREIPPGVAKYVVLSGWLNWGIAFLTIFLARRTQSAWLRVAIVLVAMISIGVNLSWTGGRSVIALYVLPLALLLYRLNGAEVTKALVIAGPLFAAYLAVVTALRKVGYEVEDTTITQVLDWEYGRFSMVGYGIDFVNRNGSLWMTTLWDALVKSVLSPVYLLGLGAAFVGSFDGSTVSQIGWDLFGDQRMIYVVPGIIGEAYMNGGTAAVLLFGALGGVGASWADKFADKTGSRSLSSRLLLSYVGSVICFNFLNSTFFAFLNYVIFMGLPLIAAAGVERLLAPRRLL